jgi:hypothetical protein
VFINWLSNTTVTPEPTIGHDPKPVKSTSHLKIYFPMLYPNVTFPSPQPSKCRLSKRFLHQSSYLFLVSSILIICSAFFSLLNFNVLTLWYKSLTSSLCNILQPSSLQLYISLITLFHTYKTHLAKLLFHVSWTLWCFEEEMRWFKVSERNNSTSELFVSWCRLEPLSLLLPDIQLLKYFQMKTNLKWCLSAFVLTQSGPPFHMGSPFQKQTCNIACSL